MDAFQRRHEATFICLVLTRQVLVVFISHLKNTGPTRSQGLPPPGSCKLLSSRQSVSHSCRAPGLWGTAYERGNKTPEVKNGPWKKCYWDLLCGTQKMLVGVRGCR